MNFQKQNVKGGIILAAAFLFGATPSAAQTNSRDRSVFTNGFGDNWEVGFGAERMSFYSSTEDGLDLSGNPFMDFRSTFGATASVGKWFSPEIGLRTKGTGYWGKALQGTDPDANKIKFFTVQEHVMLNLSNLFAGYNPSRIVDVIPYAGVGLARNCTHNENSVAIGAGLSTTFRLARQMKIYLDLGANFAGCRYDGAGNPTVTGSYRWYKIELGFKLNLGRNIWSRHANRHNQVEYVTEADGITSIDMTQVEYRKILAEAGVPSGMVLVERGHVRMGIENPDTLWGATPVRNISVDDFWMDKTEVTNRQYREFVSDVIDSVITARTADPAYNGDRAKAAASLYTVNPITGERKIDTRQLIYKYEVYDYEEEMKRRNRADPRERNLNTDIRPDYGEKVMVSKDTAYIDGSGNIVSMRITRPMTGHYDFLNTYIVNVYPDTTCWVNDFPNANNQTYARYYYSHPDYSNYPVVGVTWEQANAYCAWRTKRMKRLLGDDFRDEQPFRLPTEAEWEYAARGKTENEFPWKQEVAGYGRSTLMANFMAAEGDYTKDGNIITSRVGVYRPNTMGLYDMAGNVAEWTSTHYTAAGVEAMNNVNPQLTYKAATEDPYRLKRKSVRGGSWKDPESHIRSAWRSSEYQNQPRSYIGFRCVRSLATTPSERSVIVRKQGKKGSDKQASKNQ